MGIPLTRAELDLMTCDDPDCSHDHHDGLVFTSRCHPDAGIRAVYQDGVLEFECPECDRSMGTTIQVAATPSD